MFADTWAQDPDSVPEFMQLLLKDYHEGHLNLKIFILKLLVNNQDLFKPFGQFWIKPICELIVSKDTGGKGFHYFLRDLTTLLVLWSETTKP